MTSSKGAPKWGKSTEHNQNPISSEGGRDTSACQNSGHSSHVFSRKGLESQIWPVSLSQSGAKRRKINRPWPKCNQFSSWSKYISLPNFRLLLPCILKKTPRNPEFYQFHQVKMVHKGGKSIDIPSMCSPGNVWKPQIWPVSVSQNGPNCKRRKISRPWPKSNQLEGGQATSACQIAGHFFMRFLENAWKPLQMDEQPEAEKWSRLVWWTKGPMNMWKDGISDFAK